MNIGAPHEARTTKVASTAVAVDAHAAIIEHELVRSALVPVDLRL
jgi:hypothetical protein